MENTQYPRTGDPYELDEIMFIIWNAQCWGTDPQALKDIARIIGRSPKSIRNLLKGGGRNETKTV